MLIHLCLEQRQHLAHSLNQILIVLYPLHGDADGGAVNVDATGYFTSRNQHVSRGNMANHRPDTGDLRKEK